MPVHPGDDTPPQALFDSLDRWGLVGPRGWRRARRYLRRLARDLPRFESVWLDALVQAHQLTAFQAAEILAGRGAALLAGEYQIRDLLHPLGFARLYCAVPGHDRREPVWLAVAQCPPGDSPAVLARIEGSVQPPQDDSPRVFSWPHAAGATGDQVWAAHAPLAGRRLQEHLARYGRCPVPVAIEIVRQLAAALVEAETLGSWPGNLGVATIWLSRQGQVQAALAGVRGAVFSREPVELAGWPPELLDPVAPERWTEAAPTSAATELYSLGALAWRLLLGSPHRPGISREGMLSGRTPGRMRELEYEVPELPAPLAAWIVRCLDPDPARRPGSARELADALGPPNPVGRAAVANWVAAPGRRLGARAERIWARSARPRRWPQHLATAMAAAAVSAMWIAPSAEPPASGKPSGSSLKDAADPVTLPTAQIAPAQPSITPGAIVAATATASPIPTGDGAPVDSQRSRLDGAPPAAPGAARPTANPVAHTAPAEPMFPEQGDWVLRGEVVSLPVERLRAGQVVRSAAQERARVRLPTGGLVVTAERVRFVNIDFQATSLARAAPDRVRPLVQLQADAAHFEGCTFTAAAAPSDEPTCSALDWFDSSARPAGHSLVTGELTLERCVFVNVAAALRCDRVGAQVVELENCLLLGPGSLIERNGCPAPDEPLYLSLNRCTLRGGRAMLLIAYDRPGEVPGEVAVRAIDCAVFPNPSGALVELHGPHPPGPLWQSVRWQGEGCVIAPQAPLMRWTSEQGSPEDASDETTRMSGLVRCEVRFAGPLEAGLAAAQVVRWQAPLKSPDPPGADIGRLPELPRAAQLAEGQGGPR